MVTKNEVTIYTASLCLTGITSGFLNSFLSIISSIATSSSKLDLLGLLLNTYCSFKANKNESNVYNNYS